MALMAQITSTTSTTNADTNTESKSESESESKSKSAIGWSTRLATAALQSTEFKSHATTSLLCHLGSAITNAQPLPPYLSAGELFPLARWVRHVDGEMLSLRHVDDPWFAGFGLLEVLRSVVGVELEGLLGYVTYLLLGLWAVLTDCI